jgi:hypothetical protein
LANFGDRARLSISRFSYHRRLRTSHCHSPSSSRNAIAALPLLHPSELPSRLLNLPPVDPLSVLVLVLPLPSANSTLRTDQVRVRQSATAPPASALEPPKRIQRQAYAPVPASLCYVRLQLVQLRESIKATSGKRTGSSALTAAINQPAIR